MSIIDVDATSNRGNPTICLDDIVRESLPTVRFIANRLASRIPAHVDVDDLVQVGMIGLLQSADRFDARRGANFKTYAHRRVQGAMLDYLRSLDWKPRSVRQKSRRVEQAHRDAEQRLGRRATGSEVAEEIGITVSEMEQWANTFAMIASEQREDGQTLETVSSMAAPTESPEDILAKKQMCAVLIRAIDHLPGNERLVLSLYYYDQMTMQKVGQLLGIGQARVSQLHSQAIMRLRKRLSSTAIGSQSHAHSEIRIPKALSATRTTPRNRRRQPIRMIRVLSGSSSRRQQSA